MVVHITKQNECKRAKYTDIEIENIEKEIKCSVAFKISLAKMDERPVIKKCDSCGETFKNRWDKETHVKTIHKDMKEEGSNSNIRDLIVAVVDQSKAMGRAVEQFAKTNSSEKKMTQLTKAKHPPVWISQTFKKFAVEASAWNETN
jgi:predicted ribonuclease toxin of YeeF-YezG toxin-antitoxin module